MGKQHCKLEIVKLDKQFSFVKIHNFLNNLDYDAVWEELEFLLYKFKFKTALETGVAKHNGEAKSNKHGIWLNEIYRDNNTSNYLPCKFNWITTENIEKLIDSSFLWRHLDCISPLLSSTLLNYYEDGEFYHSHDDRSRYTQIYYTFKKPKKFTGGELVLNDFDYKINIEDNMLVVFPSVFLHEVLPVNLKECTPNNTQKVSGFGRFAITTFLEINNGQKL